MAGARTLAGQLRPASFDRFWEMLKQRRGKQPGTGATIEVLRLGREYGYPGLEAAIEKALNLSCFDVEAVRLLSTGNELARGESARRSRSVACERMSGRNRPREATTSCSRAMVWGRTMSAPTVSVQAATIRQYAKQLQLANLGGQFLALAEQAVKEKQSHLSYLKALLGAEVDERERNAVVRGSKMRTFPR
jgi:hypothetical protein